MMFFYHFIWSLLLIFFIPLKRFIRNGRLRERFALDSNLPLSAKSNIWIHALSVGEVISALPLVDAFQSQCPNQGIVFTVTTRSGMSVAREKLKNKDISLQFMPLDAWWILQKFIRHIHPSVFILVETDIWPGLLDWLRRKRIKSILVNGRISPRTFKGYNRARFLVRKLFDPFELCLMQSDLDRNRLLKIGIPWTKVKTTGNIKFDQKWVAVGREEKEKWSTRLKIKAGTFLWVAGSTHPGEEEILLDVFMKIRGSFPDFRLILAPRDIGRSGELMGMVSERDLKWSLRSGLSDGDKVQWDVLVLDTMGELGRIYGLATVSFVGGSLVQVGGHNLLEPACFGCPVLFGPYMHNFVLMSAMLLECGGGWQIHDRTSLQNALITILEDRERCSQMGAHARTFVESNQGALETVVGLIFPEASTTDF